jgi:hypothetical protein
MARRDFFQGEPMTEIHSPWRTTRLVGTTVALLAAAAVAQAQTPATASSSAPAKVHSTKAPPPPAKLLDLHTPPLSDIYSRSELRYMMAYDPDEISDSEVSVTGSKPAVNVPVTPGNQLLAVPWALMHPTQAWRIFTPVVSP